MTLGSMKDLVSGGESVVLVDDPKIDQLQSQQQQSQGA
jgi:hypothetical protein